jgi:hypothetical protein
MIGCVFIKARMLHNGRLTLTNIKVEDQSLTPLYNLRSLEELEITNQFPVEEYAKLSVQLANTRCSLFSPYINLKNSIGDKDIMITSKGSPFLNSKVDKQKILDYEIKFKKIQDRFRVSEK